MSPPLRIVSLVPSTTETLFALGVGGKVVGVTRFCVHPREARERSRIIGGTKNPRIEAIFELEPDLVLANQEENRKEDVERLGERLDVRMFFPQSVDEAVADIRSLGELVGEPSAGDRLARDIERERSRLRAEEWKPLRYLYFIWRRPYRVAGPATFIERLLSEAGLVNAAPRDRGRYPEIELSEIAAWNVGVFLLSSEPFPFEEKHRDELGSGVGIETMLVDGELLSWHGVRLRQGLPYLSSISRQLASASPPSARPFPDPSP
jgi:ABC-type Fe3+-hydroxamate transport system substrate-binding protein